MTIGEIIKEKDIETYNKLNKMRGEKRNEKVDKRISRKIHKNS